jgi:hypothetical protein
MGASPLWNNGIMEFWNNGIKAIQPTNKSCGIPLLSPNIPAFQYSNIP